MEKHIIANVQSAFGFETHNKTISDYVFHLIWVMPIPDKMFQTSYILAINKTVKQ